MSAATSVFVKHGASSWAEVALREGDTVARLLERVASKFSSWGVDASQISCFLVARSGVGDPSAEAVAAAPLGVRLQSSLTLADAGVAPSAFLLVHVNSPPRHAERVVLMLRSGRNKPVEATFSSAKDFADYAATHDVSFVSKDGLEKRIVRTLAEAQSGVEGDFLRLTSSVGVLSQRADDFTGYIDNAASSQEQATTRAIAGSAELVAELGTLTPVADAGSVVFSLKGRPEGGEAALEADGIVANSSVVVLNSVKLTPSKADVTQVRQDALTLKFILEHPEAYVSSPKGALEAMAGITHVVPAISGYNFQAAVKAECAQHNVRTFVTNGAALRRGLRTLVRAARCLR